ncbi:hypothetical protein ACHAW5_010553 [Stephanodiscus triporus]|uniref:Uncharacterized protein n=1 Tax=Stephanodiscus triporus TaxID=2934178 RepID=A0ABD3PJX0_9STRA
MPDKLCADFTCKGTRVHERHCSFKHPRSAKELQKETIVMIAKHFASKGVGWFNAWHFSQVENLPAEATPLLGGKDGPGKSPSRRALESLPAVVRPTCPAISFDCQISNKCYVSHKVYTKTAALRPTHPSIATGNADRTDCSAHGPITEADPKSITLVSAAKEKRRILDQYERDFGSGYPESIITKKKGKHDPPPLSMSRMRPALNKYYRTEEVTLHNVIAIVMRDYAAFSPQELQAIRLLDKDFSVFVPKVLHWLSVDFSPLREPRYNYQDQTMIDPRRVLMANAAMVHFGLDPGRLRAQCSSNPGCRPKLHIR